MKIVARCVIAASLSLGLSACSAHKGALWKHPPSHVNNVEVALAKPMGSPALAETLRVKTLAEASRYGMAGDPKTVRISVTAYHKKNPALSLLLGDSNHISASVTVVDSATQREDAKINLFSAEDAGIDGVVGAAIAASQTEAEVEEKLTTRFASDVLERLYGSKAAKLARRTPASPGSPPVTAPAPALKPTQPGTPVAQAAPKLTLPSNPVLPQAKNAQLTP